MTEHEHEHESETTHRSINVQPLGLRGEVVSIDLGPVGDAPIITRSDANPHTGMTNWWAQHASSMTAQVLVRHKDDLSRQLETVENDSDRTELTKSIEIIDAQLDEMLPHVPGHLEEYDRMNGNRVLLNWPVTKGVNSRLMHIHYCELVEAWQINAYRNSNAIVAIDPIAEQQGISAFTFDDEKDLHSFISHYNLTDFVVRVAPYEAGVSHDNVKVVWYLVLTNKFTPNEVRWFLSEYQQAIGALSVIYDERRRAAHMNNGIIVFGMIDHFVSREVAQLNRIRRARVKLGVGHKNNPS